MSVLIVSSEHLDDYRKLLEDKNLDNFKPIYCNSTLEAEKNISKAEVIFGSPYDIATLVDKAPNLKWVQSVYAGVDDFLKQKSRNYTLTAMKGVYGQTMSEYIFGHILMIERSLYEFKVNQPKKIWERQDCDGVEDKVIGILGFGTIGSHVAKVAKCFNMKVHVYRQRDEKAEYVDKVFTKGDFKSFLSSADYVVNILPSTKETHHILGKEEFNKMKKTSILINVGRGSSVDTAALVEAIKNKEISKAVLDVFEEEPLSQDSPLWGLENVFLTPHSAARGDLESFVGVFVDNYKRYIVGKELLYKVDFERGY